MTLIYAATSAVGWALVCDSLFGKNAVRRALVVLLHAPPFLILAWAHSDIYSLQLRVVFHYGAWTLAPWMLWLFIRALKRPPAGAAAFGGGGRRRLEKSRRRRRPAGPARRQRPHHRSLVRRAGALCAAVPSPPQKKSGGRIFFPFAVATAVGVAVGLVLREIPDFPPHRDTESFLSFNPSRTLSALSGMLYEFSRFAARNPFSALVWGAFAAIALWRLSRLRPGRAKGADSGATKWLGVPDSRAHWFAALFVPAAAAASVAAVAATGNFIPTYFDADLAPSFRYFAPLLFVPLFVGWALLPGAGALAGRGKFVVAAGAAAVALTAAPRALPLEFDKLDPFNTPFHQCFAENARRLKWEGGISTGFLALPLAANPPAAVERILPVGALRREAGNGFMYVDWTVFNRHWFSGEFQFVTVNDYRGRTAMQEPTPQRPACAPDARDACVPRGHEALFLDDAAVRGAFGVPAEIVECEGLAFYHYDPPLQFDFSQSQNPDFARVGRGF